MLETDLLDLDTPSLAISVLWSAVAFFDGLFILQKEAFSGKGWALHLFMNIRITFRMQLGIMLT